MEGSYTVSTDSTNFTQDGKGLEHSVEISAVVTAPDKIKVGQTFGAGWSIAYEDEGIE